MDFPTKTLHQKIAAAERRIATVRAWVIATNIVVYLLFVSRSDSIPWLAYSIIGVAAAYAVYVQVARPYLTHPLLLSSAFTTITDGSLIFLWLYATGGLTSPFFPVVFVSLVAVGIRYTVRATAVISGVYALGVIAMTLLLDRSGVSLAELVTRPAYVLLVGFISAIVADEMFRRTAAEVDARVSADRFQALFGAAPNGVIGCDDDGTILMANPAAATLFRSSSGSLVGQNAAALFDPAVAHTLGLEGRPATASPDVVRLTGVQARRGEETFPCDVSAAFTATEDGGLHILIVRDVTERVQAEAARARSQETQRALDAERREHRFKTDFLNMAAHELATPLTPVKIQLALLDGRIEEGDQKGSAASVVVVKRNVDRLARIVRDLLDAARLNRNAGALRDDDVDLSRAVRQEVASYRHVADERGLVLSVDIEEGLHVRGDDDRLAQVLQNLLNNALKFTPPGGRVDVCVRRDGDHACIDVQDTGPGMTQAEIERLFQPFFRTAATTESGVAGTGLGLFIAQGLIERHHGVISCTSDGVGKGATFTVRLPLWVVTTPLVRGNPSRRRLA